MVIIVERDAETVTDLAIGVSVGTVLAESIMIARDLVNHPANVMTPTKMAEVTGEVAKSVGLELDVWTATGCAGTAWAPSWALRRGVRSRPS